MTTLGRCAVAAAVASSLSLAACSNPPTAPPRERVTERVTASPLDTTTDTTAFVVTLTDLGTLGGRESRATGVNATGAVVGWSNAAGGRRLGFLWTQTQGMTALPSLATGKPCKAAHVNASGVIVGWCNNANGSERAVVWTPQSTGYAVASLGVLAGTVKSDAKDVNDAGTIIGWSATLNGRQYPVRWVNSGAGYAIEQLAASGDQGCGPAPYASPNRITPSGLIVGTVPAGCEAERATIWDATGAWVGYVYEDEYTYGVGMNDHLQLVGRAGGQGAVLWTMGLGWTTLNEGGGGIANAINGTGDVVGRLERAFIWTSAKGSQDLGALPGGTTSAALDVNDARQAVGWSTTPGGAVHAALWSIQ